MSSGVTVLLVLNTPVIAITGSSGKTTTKEMIASILQIRWNIFKTPLNHNMPQHTQKYTKLITPLHQAVVLEYGMVSKGNIKRHCRIIQPAMSVITNVGSAHIGHFEGNLKKLALAKSELIENMKSDGTLFLNADDNNSKLLKLTGFSGRVIRVGITQPAEIMARNITYQLHGMSFTVKLGQKNHHFQIPTFGWHNVYNALFAIAVATQLGFSPGEVAKGLKSYKKPRRRLQIKPGRNESTIIDDSYSSNPQALKSAIDVLVNIGEKPRIVVLGDMLELGSISARKHKEIGKNLANKDVQYICTLGEKAALISREAKKYGFDPDNVKHFYERRGLHKHLLEITRGGGTVLVKGSHNARMRLTSDFLTNVRPKTTKPANQPTSEDISPVL